MGTVPVGVAGYRIPTVTSPSNSNRSPTIVVCCAVIPSERRDSRMNTSGIYANIFEADSEYDGAEAQTPWMK